MGKTYGRKKVKTPGSLSCHLSSGLVQAGMCALETHVSRQQPGGVGGEKGSFWRKEKKAG